MGCCSTKKKNKRAVKKAARTANKKAERFGSQVQDSVQDSVSKLTGTVVPAVSEGAKDVREKASDLVDHYLPQAKDAVQHQSEKLAELAGDLGPRAEKLRQDVEEDYLPRARRTAGATNAVVASVVTAAVDAARKELDKGQDDIKKAYTAPTPKKKGRAGKVLLVLALTAAGAAAGYAVWKRTRTVEDPWAPPADFARAHYPASAATDTDSTEVSDTVGGAEAGDVAQSLRGDANTPDRTADTTPHDVKVDHASATDAKDTSAKGTHRGTSTDAPVGDQGKVIDPVMNPEENPADPTRKDGDAGNRDHK